MEALLKFTVQGHRLTKRLRANHKTIGHFLSPCTSPAYYWKTIYHRFFYLGHYVQLSIKNYILKGKKHSFKRQSKNQDQRQIWQESWNYQKQFIIRFRNIKTFSMCNFCLIFVTNKLQNLYCYYCFSCFWSFSWKTVCIYQYQNVTTNSPTYSSTITTKV